MLVGNAVLRAIQTGTFDQGGLFSTVNRLRASPGVSLAWAPSAVLGFIADARYVWTRRVSSDDGTNRTAQGVSIGGLASFDLDPVIRWPFAVQASYRGDFPVGGNGLSEVHQAGLGVYYSRRVRLALGLEVDWRHGDIRPGVQPDTHLRLGHRGAVAALLLVIDRAHGTTAGWCPNPQSPSGRCATWGPRMSPSRAVLDPSGRPTLHDGRRRCPWSASSSPTTTRW